MFQGEGYKIKNIYIITTHSFFYNIIIAIYYANKRVLSHLACCFRNWHVSPLARFVWTYVNTAIVLGSAPKQSVRDRLNEVVSARLKTNSGAVRL